MDPQRQQQLNWLFEQVFIAADEVHQALGRGLPAATYRSCLAFELEQMGRKVQQELAVPIIFREHRVDEGIKIDLIVDALVAVRVHSIENLTNFYDQEMQTVLRVSGLPLGIVVNFSVPSVRGAMHRIMNPAPRV
jgi:GxxExxY protein